MQGKLNEPGVYWLNVRYTDEQCPGMREVLSSAPMDQQSALVRGILYQWCLMHKQSGTLEQAMTNVLNGPGVNGRRRRRKDDAQAQAPKTTAAATPPVDHKQALSPAPATAPPAPPPAPAATITSEPLQTRTDPVPADPAPSPSALDGLFDMFDE